MHELNHAYSKFATQVKNAAKVNDADSAYFRSNHTAAPQFNSSITSFLCTDAAFNIFDKVGTAFLKKSVKVTPPASNGGIMTNDECLRHARDFYHYADIEGFRGTPHKL